VSTLRAVGVEKRFGGLQALSNVDIVVTPGDIAGLIGPNGAGKSTLLSILAGEQRPSEGHVFVDEQEVNRWPSWRRSRLGIARTFQNLRLFRDMSVFDNVVVSAATWRRGNPSHRRSAAAGAATSALERVGLAQPWWHRRAGDLPYIQQRMLEIARCLSTEPRYLLLDEPVAGANEPEREALSTVVRRLADDGIGILLIEHDMRFLFQLADVVTVLNYGQVISRGSADEVRRDQTVVDAYLGARADE
jgi:ABC-type branched-subunit amino acid transport system ATPase component